MKKTYTLKTLLLPFSKAFLLMIGLSFFLGESTAQTFTAITKYIDPAVGGYWEYLPINYATSGKKYPLLVYFPGIDEKGNGSQTALQDLLVNDIPKRINNGNFPKTFTVGDSTYSFIVICVQVNTDSRNWGIVKDVIDTCLRKYRVDAGKVYLTGLSQGGGQTWQFAAGSSYDIPSGKFKPLAGKYLAAAVPICGNYNSDTASAQNIARARLPVWSLHNWGDDICGVFSSVAWTDLIQYAKAKPTPLLSVFNANGHNAWSKAYDTLPILSGLNIYQWMLQYRRINDTTVTSLLPGPLNKRPVAKITGPASITLPTNTITFSGASSYDSSGGTIVRHLWDTIKVPNSYRSVYTISGDSSTANYKLSNLTAGTYIIRLTVIDNSGATDNVLDTFVVNPVATNQKPIPRITGSTSITLPTDSTTLSGTTSSDPDGTITAYQWKYVSGPAGYTLTGATTSTLKIKNLVSGSYTFRLIVTDNQSAKDSTQFTFTVNAKPVARITGSTSITLPTDSTTLSGTTSSDPNGTITAYQWKYVSGPAGYALTGAATSTLKIKNLVSGSYTFRLIVTDNQSAKDSTQFTFTVNSAPVSKVINVNVYDGANPYSNSAWNNFAVGSWAGTNLSSGILKYSNGTTSAVSAVLSRTQAVGFNDTSYHTTLAPDSVIMSSSYCDTTRTLTLNGLSVSKNYDIELYASRQTNISNSTIFLSGTQADTIATYYNLTNKAILTSLVPDSLGKIVITIKKTNTYNYLNGFKITEKTGAGARAITQPLTYAALKGIDDEPVNAKTFNIFPNPANDRVRLQLNNSHKGALSIQVTDMGGKTYKQYHLIKDQQVFQKELIIRELPAGNYLIQAQIGNWKETKKIVKL